MMIFIYFPALTYECTVWHPSPCALLGLSVDGGYGSRDGGGGLLLGLLPQVLADIRGGVGAFQLGLLPLPLAVRVRLGRPRLSLCGGGWRGGGRLGNTDLRGVQVDAVGRGVVVAVGAGHYVQELAEARWRRGDDKNETVKTVKNGMQKCSALNWKRCSMTC